MIAVGAESCYGIGCRCEAVGWPDDGDVGTVVLYGPGLKHGVKRKTVGWFSLPDLPEQRAAGEVADGVTDPTTRRGRS